MTKRKNVVFAIVIFVIIAIISMIYIVQYFSPHDKTPNRFITLRDVGVEFNPLISFSVEDIKLKNETFSLNNAPYVAKLTYLSHKILPSDDVYYQTSFVTMKVKEVIQGNLENGDKLDFVIYSRKNKMVEGIKDAKTIILAFEPSSLEANKFTPVFDFHGLFYLQGGYVYPACDMTTGEIFDIPNLGNPVEKYIGMSKRKFKQEFIK